MNAIKSALRAITDRPARTEQDDIDSLIGHYQCMDQPERERLMASAKAASLSDVVRQLLTGLRGGA